MMNNDNPSVLIMMASFNGEKYIREQIESILNQSFENWKLIIQDDCSSDKTLSVINEYVKEDNRIRLLINDGEHGAYYNFHSLINKCKTWNSNYYMFADHDDIWHADKIQTMVNYFEQNTTDDVPTMIYGDMEIIDGKGNKTGKRINDLLKLKYRSQLDPFFNHTVFGCNCMINSELFNLVPSVNTNDKVTSILCHDNYYAKYAAIFGQLIYIDSLLMDYRRYGENVTSKHEYSYGIKKIVRRLSKIDGLAKDHACTYSQSIYTIKKILDNDKNTFCDKKLKTVLDIMEHGGICAVFKCIHLHISCGMPIRTFSRYFIILTKLYKKHLCF